MAKPNIKTVGIELAKTVGGFVAGRAMVVMGEKALKVSEETDDKKKKIKEVGVGLGVAAVGTAITMKAPTDYVSVGAGMATAGVIAAISPFGKEDKGFIPVLHGTEDDAYIDIDTELNGETEDEIAEREYREFIEEEKENLGMLAEVDDEPSDDELELNELDEEFEDGEQEVLN